LGFGRVALDTHFDQCEQRLAVPRSGQRANHDLADAWCSVNAVNSSFNVFLLTQGNWPRQPGYSCFLAVADTSAMPQPFSFVLNGEGPGSGPFGFTGTNYLSNGNVQLNRMPVPG